MSSVPDAPPGTSPGICFRIIGVQRHSGSWCRRRNDCRLNTNALRHRRTIAFLHGSVCLRFINIVCAHAIHVQKITCDTCNAAGDCYLQHLKKPLCSAQRQSSSFLFLLFNSWSRILILETSDLLCGSLFKRFFHNLNRTHL